MVSKKFILILGIVLVFISVLGVYASEYQHDINEFNEIIKDTNSSELTGCCSVVYQANGTDSILSFRRDANYTADIHIEEVDWHGKKAVKQYKDERGYFCQAVVTEDGWVFGFGGLDDGPDNEAVENISAGMMSDDNTISEEGLKQIQAIKKAHGRGHAVIKAPNGNYGVAMATNEFRGKLEPGDYISVPNKYAYYTSGNFTLDTPNKIGKMNDLARSDMYGIVRRDITTFNFHTVDNDTFKGNVTDLYLSNDDGSLYEMNTGGMYDNVYFRDMLIEGSSLPIAPNYMSIGDVEYQNNFLNGFGFFEMALFAISAILIGVLVYFLIQYYKYLRYMRRRRYR